jgi:epoxyqueuosine reductase
VSGSKKELKSRLRKFCMKRGAVTFGVASVRDVDSLPRIKLAPMMKYIMWTKLNYTKAPTEAMPEARSLIVFGIPSTDDSCELAVHGKGKDWDFPGYDSLSWIRRDVARFLEKEGYKVVYPYELDAPNSYKRIIKLAGIGAFGKNSLIITPEYGPWIRYGYLLTNADLQPDKPFEKNLCGDCVRCIESCPVGALSPYVVDSERCLVGIHLLQKVPREARRMLNRFEPQLTPATHVMCTRCQIVCPYTSRQRRRNVFAVRAVSQRR